MFSIQELQSLPELLHKLRTRLDGVTPGIGSTARAAGTALGGPAWWAMQGAMQPDIIKPPATAQAPQETPAEAPSSTPAQPMPAMGGMGLFPPAQPQPMDWLKGAQWQNPSPPQAPAPAPVTADAGGLPMPQARPADAPQAQPGAPASPADTSFFMRNALMMRDPTSNQLIDPSGAASVRGPDLINKMMAYLHNKDMG